MEGWKRFWKLQIPNLSCFTLAFALLPIFWSYDVKKGKTNITLWTVLVGEETLNQINSDALGTTALQIEASLVCYNMGLNMSLQCIRHTFTRCNNCAVEIHGSLLSKIIWSVCGIMHTAGSHHCSPSSILTWLLQWPTTCHLKIQEQDKVFCHLLLCSTESDIIGLLPLLSFIWYT